MDGGIARSVDDAFSVSIPPHHYGGTIWIVISDERFCPDDGPFVPLSSAYRFGCEGERIDAPSVCRIAFEKAMLDLYEPGDIGIYRKVGDELTYVKTWIDPESAIASASITEFGTYMLVFWPGKGESDVISERLLSISCYPNPAKDAFSFDYLIPAAGTVDISLYDAAGRRVKLLERNSARVFGLHTGYCDLKEDKLSGGVYFLRIAAQSNGKTFSSSRKIIVVR
jgi:hypothetical protein